MADRNRLSMICFFSVGVLLYFFLVSSAAVNEIKKVSINVHKEKCEVTVEISKGVAHNLEFVDNPPRVVVDFPAASPKFTKRIFQPENNPFVSRIRLSEHSENGSTTFRMVVDLKAPYEFLTDSRSDKLTVIILTKQREQLSPALNQAADPRPPIAPVLIVIGPEDLLEISVFDLPQFNVTGRVSGDGTITMPLVGSVEVGRLSKKQAEERIAQALEAKYITNANVSVQIKEYKSKQVSVLGAVKQPGPYYIFSNRSLLQVLSDAGGLTQTAGNKCFVFRSGDSKIEINLEELLNSGRAELNIPIMPGDIINVPAEMKVIVFVLGAVKNPGAVEMDNVLPASLLRAIARAGGLTDQASQSNVQVKRQTQSGEDVILKVNIKEILKGKKPDISLYPGDVINVPESFF